MDRALLVLSALLLNVLLAGPRRWYRLIGVFQWLHKPEFFLRELERKLNGGHRSANERETRGIILVCVGVMLAIMIGLFIGSFEALQMISLALFLPVRPLYDQMSLLRKQLQSNDIKEARQTLETPLLRYTSVLDEHGLARTGIEVLAIGFAEKILSPVFWYLCVGASGLFITLTINLLYEVLHKPSDASFGKAASLAYAVWHFIPSRIAALLWWVASLFLPGRDAYVVLTRIGRGLFTDAPHMLTLTSAAAVLRISLGGPTSVYGNQQWIDAGTAKATPADLRRALYLFALLCLFLFLLLGLFL